MQNQFNVVMLPTEKASNLLLTSKGVLIQCFAGGERENAIRNGAKCQDVHIVDTHTIINVGDWYIDNTYGTKSVFRCEVELTLHKKLYTEDCKIIASTDKSLGLPEIPQSFIEAYVENQNIEITNVIKYSQEDVHIVLKGDEPLWEDDCNYRSPETREQFNIPKEYNQIPFTEQEQEDFKQVVECSKELQNHTCKRCGGQGHHSKALNNTLVSFDDEDGRGQVQARIGNAELVDCIKCEDCGHSWIPEQVIWTPEQLKILNEMKLEALNEADESTPITEESFKEYSDFMDNLKIQKQQMIKFISLEKQQELWDKWESYSITVKSEICKRFLNRDSIDCYVDMNDLIYLNREALRDKVSILVAKVKIVSLLTNNYFGECDYTTLHEAHVTNIDYNVSINTYTITLCRPGLLIGKGGEGYDRLCKELNAKIEIIEHKWY